MDIEIIDSDLIYLGYINLKTALSGDIYGCYIAINQINSSRNIW